MAAVEGKLSNGRANRWASLLKVLFQSSPSYEYDTVEETGVGSSANIIPQISSRTDHLTTQNMTRTHCVVWIVFLHTS